MVDRFIKRGKTCPKSIKLNTEEFLQEHLRLQLLTIHNQKIFNKMPSLRDLVQE